MKAIDRKDIPKSCPHCEAELKAYHGPGSITRLVCSVRCFGYEEVVTIDHNLEARGDSNAIQLVNYF